VRIRNRFSWDLNHIGSESAETLDWNVDFEDGAGH
jgi:hypothetical protein